jgi:ATP phosphoribosyltransferase
MTLRLGIPSKGRLMDKTADWFAARGLAMRRTGSDRDYGAEIDGADVELRLLSAGEIPRELAAGRIHLGVTGSDLVQERIPGWDQAVEPLAPMGFGHADLVIAVPVGWVDVMSLDDLDAVAAEFRARHGHRLRIATKYHRLVREFLRDAGSRTTASSTARARPRRPSPMARRRRWPTSPRPGRPCAPITSRCCPTR